MAKTEKITNTSWRQSLAGRRQLRTLSSNPEVADFCGFVDFKYDQKKRQWPLRIYIEDDPKLDFTDEFKISSGHEVTLPKNIQNSLLIKVSSSANPYVVVEVLLGKNAETEDGNKVIDELKKYYSSLSQSVTESLKDPDHRKKRLKEASKKPEVITVKTTIYKRNPDVIAETLDIAGGICQECGKRAPFNRKIDGSPYLEVHHRIPLSEGGEDTVENAVALCPNCHRKNHFGEI